MSSAAYATMTPAQMNAAVEKASAAVSEGKPAIAVAEAEKVIAESPATKPAADTQYVCTNGPVETLTALVGATAAPKKGTTVAIDSAFCDALFLKGFALIDLNRGAEAEPLLRQATELAPSNAHYMNEYAEWYKSARDWNKSYALFSRAAELGPNEAEDIRVAHTARALRGMAFSLSEMGKLDEAEAKLNESLKYEPDSAAAKNEIAYIKQERAKLGK